MAKTKEAQGGQRRLLRVLSDLPVGGGCDPDDLHFKFDGIARTLAEVALNPANETPFTVVIRAGWGRGKTTLMQQIEHHFQVEAEGGADGQRRVDTLWFNAWKYPDEEKILAGLLGKLIDEFRRDKSLLKQLVIRVDELKEGLARAILKTAAPWIFVGGVGGVGRYDPVYERRAFYDTFSDLFKQLLYLWRHRLGGLRDTQNTDLDAKLKEEQGSHALAIFLDDLDRCSTSRVAEVLEAIYRFQDLPGVCFYLGLDWGRLCDILHRSFPDQEERFLDKVFQLSYQIPDVSAEGARSYLDALIADSELASWLGEDGVVRLSELASSLEVRHPRYLKRFLNDLSMSLAVLANTCLLEKDEAESAPEAVPAGAVLALHALSWIVPAVRKRLESAKALGDLLKRFDALEDGERPDTLAPGALDLHRDQRWIFDTLQALSGPQRDTLVHFGSPVRESADRPKPTPPGTARSPVPDLRQLDGGGWVELPAGSFVMGATELDRSAPEHLVNLRPFRISKFPVTNREYARFVAAEKADPPAHWEEGKPPKALEDHPVVLVAWEDARAYTDWLSGELGGGEEGPRVRLPSEAQWEYAARGGEGRSYPWGEEEPGAELANFGGQVGATTPVNRYPAGSTPDGVYDLAGNVWECVEDDWHRDYDGAPDDGSPWVEDPRSGERVVRGGSFSDDSSYIRAVYRDLIRPEHLRPIFGFRVVCGSAGGQR